MIVMDSGLGGISVVRALRASLPSLPLTYIADTGGFPYGQRTASDITDRAERVILAATNGRDPGSIILACNTLSTLCLDQLRERFPFPFVGTVPAIKVAAGQSVSRRFTLLATPNTAQSSYSQKLIQQFAADCVVDCYGAPNLARYAEQILLGDRIDPALLRAELAPAFADDARGRTDAIVLGCTHYPLIHDALRDASPWPVTWIDSSAAIARRAQSQPDVPPSRSIAYVTRAEDVERYRPVFLAEGFDGVEALPL